MKTHTQGPWILGETSHDILARRGTPVASPCDGYDEARWAIDGQLIAAAPELLASCKELRDALAGAMRVMASLGPDELAEAFIGELARIGILDGVGVRADAAIAKAEGR